LSQNKFEPSGIFDFDPGGTAYSRIDGVEQRWRHGGVYALANRTLPATVVPRKRDAAFSAKKRERHVSLILSGARRGASRS
jgi:hypothetical protein